jgi:putative SOS response-associated peptidase YedK
VCGRYSLTAEPATLAAVFALTRAPRVLPRYNIAPSQEVLIVRQAGGRRELALVRWGLVPSFATDPNVGYKMINARAETIDDKPSFRESFRRRRCVVLADGFYEWKKGAGKKRTAHHMRRSDGLPFALAAIWDRWRDRQGQVTFSCAIVTVPANQAVAAIHERMPALLDEAQTALWLADDTPLGKLHELLVPASEEALVIQPVSSFVNSPANEGPACLAPEGA